MLAGEPLAPCASDATDSTASSLLLQLRADSPAAWNRFVAIYSPLVYRWARRAGVPPRDAPDIVQDVFQGVALRIRQFRRERPGDSFRGWLYAVTRYKVCDYFRREHDQAEATGGSDMQVRLAALADDYGEFSDSIAQSEDSALVLRTAVEQLRDEFTAATWTAFWRLAIEGHRAADIAHDLGLTAKAVRQAKYRVLKRLREELVDVEW